MGILGSCVHKMGGKLQDPQGQDLTSTSQKYRETEFNKVMKDEKHQSYQTYVEGYEDFLSLNTSLAWSFSFRIALFSGGHLSLNFLH